MCKRQVRDSVAVDVISPTRRALVRDRRFEPDAYWKVVGGSIEKGDDSPIAAVIREVREETGDPSVPDSGIQLLPEEITLVFERPFPNGSVQYFFVARVSEEKLDTHGKVGDEDGAPLDIQVVRRVDTLSMPDLLEWHKEIVRLDEKK